MMFTPRFLFGLLAFALFGQGQAPVTPPIVVPAGAMIVIFGPTGATGPAGKSLPGPMGPTGLTGVTGAAGPSGNGTGASILYTGLHVMSFSNGNFWYTPLASVPDNFDTGQCAAYHNGARLMSSEYSLQWTGNTVQNDPANPVQTFILSTDKISTINWSPQDRVAMECWIPQ